MATPKIQRLQFVRISRTARTSNSQSYDIYSNSTVNATGAKQLTNAGFAFVFSLQYTPDGTKILFVAQTQAWSKTIST